MRIIPIFLILSTFLIAGCVEEESSICTDKETGNELSLAEARIIALDSECANEGDLTFETFCNEDTGTVWIDLDIVKEGCAPACVVDVNTKTASINWRCTGLI